MNKRNQAETNLDTRLEPPKKINKQKETFQQRLVRVSNQLWKEQQAREQQQAQSISQQELPISKNKPHVKYSRFSSMRIENEQEVEDDEVSEEENVEQEVEDDEASEKEKVDEESEKEVEEDDDTSDEFVQVYKNLKIVRR